MGNTNGNAKREAAVADVIAWLEGRLIGMADLLEDALNCKNHDHQVTAGFLLANDLKDAARAAAQILKGSADRFEWDRYEAEADPIGLVHLLQLPPLGNEGERGDEAREILREAAALLETRIANSEGA